MERLSVMFVDILQTSGMFAPLAFIFLHLLRQFVFVPVSLICMIGGVFFGAVFGTMYSLVGLTLASICFYVLFKRVPSLFRKVQKLKDKYFKKRVPFSIGQMAILRVIPLIQFHLISLCLIEATSDFKEYTKMSFVANIPLAVVYTMCGQWIGHLSTEWMILIFVGFAVLFYLLRKREWVIKWDDFFATRST